MSLYLEEDKEKDLLQKKPEELLKMSRSEFDSVIDSYISRHLPGFGGLATPKPQKQFVPTIEEKPTEPSRGWLGDIGSGIARGGVRLAEDVGHIMKYVDEPGGADMVRGAGQAITDWTQKLVKDTPYLQPSKEEKESIVKRAVTGGLESFLSSGAIAIGGGLAAGAITKAALGGGVIGGLPGALIGATGAALASMLFRYGTVHNRSYEQIKEAKPNMTEDEVKRFAAHQARAEAIPETAGTFAEWLIFRGFKPFAKTAVNVIEAATVKEMMRTPIKETLKQIGKATPFEVGTEMITSYYQHGEEKRQGLTDMTTWDAVKEAIGPAVVMSMLFGFGMRGVNSLQERGIKKALANPEADIQARANAIKFVESKLEPIDKQFASEWYGEAMKAVSDGRAIDIDENMRQFVSPINPKAKKAKEQEIIKAQDKLDEELSKVAVEPTSPPLVEPEVESPAIKTTEPTFELFSDMKAGDAVNITPSIAIRKASQTEIDEALVAHDKALAKEIYSEGQQPYALARRKEDGTSEILLSDAIQNKELYGKALTHEVNEHVLPNDYPDVEKEYFRSIAKTPTEIAPTEAATPEPTKDEPQPIVQPIKAEPATPIEQVADTTKPPDIEPLSEDAFRMFVAEKGEDTAEVRQAFYEQAANVKLNEFVDKAVVGDKVATEWGVFSAIDKGNDRIRLKSDDIGFEFELVKNQGVVDEETDNLISPENMFSVDENEGIFRDLSITRNGEKIYDASDINRWEVKRAEEATKEEASTDAEWEEYLKSETAEESPAIKTFLESVNNWGSELQSKFEGVNKLRVRNLASKLTPLLREKYNQLKSEGRADDFILKSLTHYFDQIKDTAPAATTKPVTVVSTPKEPAPTKVAMLPEISNVINLLKTDPKLRAHLKKLTKNATKPYKLPNGETITLPSLKQIAEALGLENTGTLKELRDRVDNALGKVEAKSTAPAPAEKITITTTGISHPYLQELLDKAKEVKAENFQDIRHIVVATLSGGQNARVRANLIGLLGNQDVPPPAQAGINKTIPYIERWFDGIYKVEAKPEAKIESEAKETETMPIKSETEDSQILHALEQMRMKMAQEVYGESMMNEFEHLEATKGFTPDDIVNVFVAQTYPALNAKGKMYFNRLIEKQHGKPDNDFPTHLKVLQYDVPTEFRYIEGAARGLYVLMDEANKRMKNEPYSKLESANVTHVSKTIHKGEAKLQISDAAIAHPTQEQADRLIMVYSDLVSIIDEIRAMAHPSTQIEFKDFIEADDAMRNDIEKAWGRISDIAGLHYVKKTRSGLFRSYIEISLSNNRDIRELLRHETWHHISRLLLNEKERSILGNKYRGKEGGMSSEELQAEAFAVYYKNPKHLIPQSVKELFDRIKNFFERFGNVLRGYGFQTADDVFRKAEQGEYKTRTPDYSYALKLKAYQGYNIDIDLEQKRRLENGRYVFERIPQAAELESSENNIGNASNVVKRIHRTISQLEAPETATNLERRKRLREIADKIKPEETKALIQWAKDNNLMLSNEEFENKWVEQGELGGVEHNVYIDEKTGSHIKSNALKLHSSWLEYFNRLSIHNWLFPNSQYKLEGFIIDKHGDLHAVTSQQTVKTKKDVKGNAVIIDRATTRKYMKQLGFEPTKEDDYINHKLGIIVEDLHGENIIIDLNNEIHIIDPVIYMDANSKIARLRDRYKQVADTAQRDAAIQRGAESIVMTDAFLDTLKNKTEEIKTRHFVKVHSSDIDIAESHLSLPSMKALKFPAWKDALDVELHRMETRSDEWHKAFKRLKPITKLSKTQIAKLEKALIEGDIDNEFKDQYQKLRQEYINTGDEAYLAQMREMHKGYSDDVLREKFGFDDKTIEAYRRIRESFNKILMHRLSNIEKDILKKYEDREWYPVMQALGGDMTAMLIKVSKKSENAVVHLRKTLAKYETNSLKNVSKNVDAQKAIKKNIHELLEQYFGDTKTKEEIVKFADEMTTEYTKAHTSLNTLQKLRNDTGIMLNYFPRVREQGRYSLTIVEIVEDEDGNPVEKVRYYTETKNNAVNTVKGIINDAATKLGIDDVEGFKSAMFSNATKQSDAEFNGYKLIFKVKPRESDTSYTGIDNVNTQRVIDNAIDKLRADGNIDETTQEELRGMLLDSVANELKSRGAGKYWIERDSDIIYGYKETNLMPEVLNYTSGYYGLVTKQEAARQYIDVLKNIGRENPNLFNDISIYVKDMLRNTDHIDKKINSIKSWAAMWYLGGNLKSVVVQLTQNFVTGVPVFAQELREMGKGGYFKALKEYNKAAKDVMGYLLFNKGLSAEERTLFDEMLSKNIANDQFVREMRADIEGKFAGKLVKGFDLAMKLFSEAEKFNRMSAALAMYRQTKDKGYDFAFEKSKRFIFDTHYLVGKENLPRLLSGGDPLQKFGKLAYIFQTFPHQFILSLYYKGLAKKDLRYLGQTLASIGLLGGITSLPFMSDIFTALLNETGEDYVTRMKRWLRKAGGKEFEEFGLHGLAGLVGINLSGSLSVSPPMLSSVATGQGSPFGVTEGMLRKVEQAVLAAKRGDIGRAVESISPESLANPMRAMRMSQTGKEIFGTAGVATTPRGKVLYDENGKPISFDDLNMARKVVGFQPVNYSEQMRVRHAADKIIEYFKDKKNKIYEEYRIGLLKNDPNAFKDMYASIKEYNEKLKDNATALIVMKPLKLSDAIANAKQKPHGIERKKIVYQHQANEEQN